MRYADYEPSANRTGPILTVPPTVRKRSAIDKIRDAIMERQFWVLRREPDWSWTLRKLDDTTGVIGEPVFASGPLGADGPGYGAALEWARGAVDVEDWTQLVDGDTTVFVDELRQVIADLTWRPHTGRALVVRIEDERGLRLVVVRERWTATGRLGVPMFVNELSMFKNMAAVLDWASERFGVDRGHWVTVAKGREYQHL